MRAELELVTYSVAAPAAAALAAAWLGKRFLPAEVAQRYTLALALAAGFAAGYWLLPERPPLVPTRHWQWLPYVAAAAAVLGPVSIAAGAWRGERWLVYALVALAAAWLLVPTWKHLQPPPVMWFRGLALYLFLLMALLSALPDRLLGRLLAGALAASAAALAVLIAIGLSVKVGHLALLGAAASAGCFAASFFAGLGQPATIRGLIAVFAVLVGGLAFVGAVEPDPKMPVLLLAPAAPLTLWLFAAGPLARLGGLTLVATQTAAVAIPLAIALVWVAVSDGR